MLLPRYELEAIKSEASLWHSELERCTHLMRDHERRYLSGDDDALTGYEAAHYGKNDCLSKLAAIEQRRRSMTAPPGWTAVSVRPNGDIAVTEDHLLVTVRRGGTITTVVLLSS